MQAIETKYICPTNSRPSRIKASCQAAKIMVSYDSLQNECIELGIINNEENVHILAAKKLREKLNWTEEYYGAMVKGDLHNGSCIFVFTGRNNCYVVK